MALDHPDFKNRLEEIRSSHSDWIAESQKDYEFLSLKQWDHATLAALQAEGRPGLTFDRTRPIIQGILGSQITQRFQSVCLPRDASINKIDRSLAESGSKTFRFVQGRGNFEQTETLVFQDALVAGVGCDEMYVSYEEEPDGEIRMSRVPVGTFGWDPSSTEPGMRDARYVIRARWIDRSEIEQLYGDGGSGLALSTADQSPLEESSRVQQTTPAYSLFGGSDVPSYDRTRDQLLIFEKQCFERRYQTRILAPDIDRMDMVIAALQGQGQMPRLDMLVEKEKADDAFVDLSMRVQAVNMQLTGRPEGPLSAPSKIDKFPVRVYYSSVHSMTEMLNGPEVMNRPSFTYLFITAFEDWSVQGRRQFFGLMRPMRDPQKYANKFLSQAVHLFTSNPKGAVMAEMDMFEDVAKAASEWNKATGFIPVKPGSLSNTPKPKYAQLSSTVSLRGIETLLGYAMSAVAASVGISEASFLGQAGDVRRISGEALNSLLGQQQKTQTLPFDSLRLFRKGVGKLMLSFIQTDLDEQLLLRVLDPVEDAAFLNAYRSDALVDEYDIIVEEAPVSPNERHQIFQILTDSQILAQFLSNGIPLPPSLAEFFPLPTQATSELHQSLSMTWQIQMASMELQLQQLAMQKQRMMTGQPPQQQGETEQQ